MFVRSILIAAAVLISGAYAADLSEKFAKRLESADVAYQAAVLKADNARYYALQKANADRVKLLKSALTDATKAGDFDAAAELKLRLTAAESAGFRTKPKNTLKFGNHEYALIPDKVTWHVAKRLCEEMGGHLIYIETSQEADFIKALCGQQTAWMGATDEEQEGKWHWINGRPVELQIEFGGDEDHALALHNQAWLDGRSCARFAFVCEWDN